MPLPWKKSKSSRISRFVTDLHQSPKHGGSLVVETGFPTSLIDLFVKNRDRLKKPPPSKRSIRNKTLRTQTQTAFSHSNPTRRRVSSPPSPALPPPSSLQRHRSLPQKLDPALVNDDLPSVSFVKENRHVGEVEDDGGSDGNHGGGGGCVLMVVVIKVFMVAVLALSTKKLAVGITLSTFALLLLELVVARVFTLLNLCPDAQIRLNSLIRKLIGKRPKEEEESSSSRPERRSKVFFEITEESKDEEVIQVVPQEDLAKAKPLEEEKQVQTIRDVVFKTEKSKSAKLKSKIVKKIVPKKLRSYKKKKKMKKMEEKEEEVEVEEEGSVTEVSSLYSEDRIDSDISEKDDVVSNPPLLESYEDETGSKGDLTKAMFLILIALTGLLGGKVFAIGLTLLCCLILRVFSSKSQTSL